MNWFNSVTHVCLSQPRSGFPSVNPEHPVIILPHYEITPFNH